MSAIEPAALPEPHSGGSGVTALQRAVGFLRWLSGLALRLVIVALAASVAVWWALSRILGGAPEERTEILVALGLLLVAPLLILGLVAFGIRGLAALPQRLGEARSQAGELIVEARRRLADVAEARRRGLISGLVALFRLGWVIRSSREILDIAGPAALVLSPWVLAVTFVAVLLALLEVLAGAIALIWLALA